MTLGMAFLAGLQPHVRCLRGRRMGPAKVEPCGYSAELDFETLIWTRGAAFPCWRLEQRLKCPRCGGTSLAVAWHPGAWKGERMARDLVQCAKEVEKTERARRKGKSGV